MRKVLIDEPYPDLGPELDLSGPVTGFARLHRIQHAILVQREGSKQQELPTGQIERMASNEGQLVRTDLKRPRD